MDDTFQQDICRVCRSEAAPDKPLYHPCICTGSIKFIHQECLLQWLKYSRKEYCELCNHRFSFMPIYSPDMPKRLPIKDIVTGLFRSLGTAVRYWFHYTLVAIAWLGIIPLTACRIYRSLFSGSLSNLLTLPLNLFSTENILSDCLYGCCVVTCTLCTFISLVWLREQILHGGGPDWLEDDVAQAPPQAPQENDNNNGADVPEGGPDIVEPPVMPAALPVPALLNDVNNGPQDDINWNPIEWDRAAEELTWERLLGLDGSLVFLEHVFWVASLNTMFILVFAFLPYHIGHAALTKFEFLEWVETSAAKFEGLLTTLAGYVVIGVGLVIVHGMAHVIHFPRTRRLVGLCYVVVKVCLLSVVEIGVFPLACGWWLDLCSLTLLSATLRDREEGLRAAPGTSMFIHWLVGMVYVFYFASFILLLREVVRPGVLWFLRNLNDPDFNPIQEMIHLSIIRHLRRFVASLVTFGMTVLLMVYVPVKVIERIFPDFLPYNVILSSESPVSELSLELMLLQIVLPALLEQGHIRHWMKTGIRTWCMAVAHILDLKSYLLGDEPVEGNEPQEENQQPPAEGPGLALAAAHQALLLGNGNTAFQVYKKPPYFAFKIFLLLLIICVSLMTCSFVSLTVPVFLGRKLMHFWMGSVKVHELYTVGAGLYTIWMTLRATTILFNWLPRGWNAVLAKVREWLVLLTRASVELRKLLLKALVIVVVLVGLIPFLFGLLFDLVVVVPLRVTLYQTPLFSLAQDWALGVLHTKIICALTLMGPNWWMKRTLEQMYNAGLRHIDLKLVLVKLSLPVVISLGLCLSVPYILACSIVPLFTTSFEMQNLVYRRIYPSFLAAFVIILLVIIQIRQFCRLYEHIKNDKYLVGRRLVNYDHHKPVVTAVN